MANVQVDSKFIYTFTCYFILRSNCYFIHLLNQLNFNLKKYRIFICLFVFFYKYYFGELKRLTFYDIAR